VSRSRGVAGIYGKKTEMPFRRFFEVGGTFLRLGCVSFGGPIAHLGYFRRECVEKRRWLDDSQYADLVALCQVLPGPTSSQVAFGLGMRRAGIPGALLASLGFLLPSATLMILFAYGSGLLGNPLGAGWIHGLKLAAVAVVARAVWAMGLSLCPDWGRRSAALGAAGIILIVPGAFSQVGLIAVAALIGALVQRGVDSSQRVDEVDHRGRGAARVSLVLFGLLLVILPVAARLSGSKPVAVFDSFFRSGALVFGGGHVVLPLLRAEVVPRGWASDDVFLAGYGAAQALPGPLFAFAGYLGAVISGPPWAWLGGLLALGAIFLPGFLLVAGAYPYWHHLRARRWFPGAVKGANVAVVGILLAALCTPLGTESIQRPIDAAAALAALILFQIPRIPQWVVIGLMAAAGQWILR
jgi:chromate transporter